MQTSRAICHAHNTEETVTLSYDARFLRRKVLTMESGEKFLVDLEHTTSLGQGDAFILGDGRRVGVRAALEDVLEVKGRDLVRLAWHIGNRHTPCQIDADRLLIQPDHVLKDMLTKLGADLNARREVFEPEGGAYGHGRTHGHQH